MYIPVWAICLVVGYVMGVASTIGFGHWMGQREKREISEIVAELERASMEAADLDGADERTSTRV